MEIAKRLAIDTSKVVVDLWLVIKLARKHSQVTLVLSCLGLIVFGMLDWVPMIIFSCATLVLSYIAYRSDVIKNKPTRTARRKRRK